MRLARRGTLSRNFECRYVASRRPCRAARLDRHLVGAGPAVLLHRPRHDRAHHAREPAAPGAEDGGGRPAHRRRRARLQQHPDRHHRHDRAADGLASATTRSSRRSCRRSTRRPRAARSSPSACWPSPASSRCRRATSTSTRSSTRTAAMLQRTLGEDIAVEARARRRAVAGARRPVAARGRDPQPRGQCARRHAERRPAGDRDRQHASRRAIRGAERRGDGRRLRRRWWSPTPAPACRPRWSSACSSRSSPPRRSAAAPGSGLSMVYGFVKQSRGHVKIYSEVGHGTSIKLYLPRADAARRPRRKPRRRARPRIRPARETILVVEDSADGAQRRRSRSCAALGYRVQRGRGRPRGARDPAAAGRRSTCCSPT